MQEVIKLFSDWWFDALKAEIPEDCKIESPTVMSWLTITWVLRQPVEFKHLTKLIGHEGHAVVD